MRERESLFNEYIVDVRRKEKDEKKHRRENVSGGNLLSEQFPNFST